MVQKWSDMRTCVLHYASNQTKRKEKKWADDERKIKPRPGDKQLFVVESIVKEMLSNLSIKTITATVLRQQCWHSFWHAKKNGMNSTVRTKNCVNEIIHINSLLLRMCLNLDEKHVQSHTIENELDQNSESLVCFICVCVCVRWWYSYACVRTLSLEEEKKI